MNINEWFVSTKLLFKNAGIKSFELDAKLILEHRLKISREKITAHPEIELSNADLKSLNKLREARLKHTPMAYILGRKEFYGRDFMVDKNVLIPRPETESVIELTKKVTSNFETPKILDVGTGSGCIGITIALEIPSSIVTIVDKSSEALSIARKNATKLNANVISLESNLLNDVNDKYDVLIANLPYVDKAWKRSKETDYEPAMALFARNDGLELINKLIKQAPKKLNEQGYLVLEADPVQHKAIVRSAKQQGFTNLEVLGYALLFRFQSSQMDQVATTAKAKQQSRR